jgi:hypothetical protein
MWERLQGDWSQVPTKRTQHKTNRLTPYSRQKEIQPDPSVGATIASFAPLPTRVRINFYFFRMAKMAHS